MSLLVKIIDLILRVLTLRRQRTESEEFQRTIRQTHKVERLEEHIEKIKPDANSLPKSPAEWNKMRLVFLMWVFILSGCAAQPMSLQSHYPILQRPERPTLPEGPAFNEREMKLVEYAVHLEQVIDTYNQWASRENEKIVPP